MTYIVVYCLMRLTVLNLMYCWINVHHDWAYISFSVAFCWSLIIERRHWSLFCCFVIIFCRVFEHYLLLHKLFMPRYNRPKKPNWLKSIEGLYLNGIWNALLGVRYALPQLCFYLSGINLRLFILNVFFYLCNLWSTDLKINT